MVYAKGIGGLVLGLVAVTLAAQNTPEVAGRITQAVAQHRGIAPVFGQPITVTELAVPAANTLAVRLRAKLTQINSGAVTPKAPPIPRVGAVTAFPAPPASTTSIRQQQAVSELRRVAGNEIEIHLRPENQTIRQLRAGELLGDELRRTARAATGGAPTKESLARTFLRTHRDVLRLEDPDAELVVSGDEEDLLGFTHVRFQQYHRGRPVALAGLTAHFDAEGRLNLIDGAYIPTPAEIEDTPVISADDAVKRGQASVPAGFRGTVSPVQCVIHAPLEGPTRLAWEFELIIGFSQAWNLTVDATDARILSRRTRIYDAGANGTGSDLFGNTRSLNLWRQGNTYYLADTSKQMFNLAGDPITNPKGVISVLDARGTGINDLDDNSVFAITSLNPNQWSVPAGISAAFNFAQTYDYYLERHSRNSINGSGGNITAVVGVGGYDNASWHGNLSMMFFGDVRKYPGALDVVAHELTHGVTENSANLVYELQPGALNEAFSDILGECVEARTRAGTDWKLGSELGQTFRDLKNPGSLVIGGLNRPYPSRFSQFIVLANSPSSDNGGVHLNSSIINHTFYQLAEGLNGALGIPEAERIFYRCLTQHLKARSQFLDCRLGCIAAAEAIFGGGSRQALKTAEAFDATEIFAGPTAPPPAPLPPVNAPDSLMFVYYDPAEQIHNLGRREAALNDDAILGNFRFAFDVRPTRPSLTGDGELVVYVDSLKTVCLATTAPPSDEECILSTRGMVHSIAVAPDASRAAFVPIDPVTGDPRGQIVVFGVLDTNLPTRIYDLVSPGLDGVSVDQILNADAMTFSTDGHELVYDARSRIRFNAGAVVEAWSLYNLNLDTDRTAILVPPVEGIDTGNPTVGRTGTRYVAFDAMQSSDGENTILILDTFTGDVGGVAENGKVLGYPSFSGDEMSVLFAQEDNSASESSLMLQRLSADHLKANGPPGLFYSDATLGTLYRRGVFVGQNAPPTIGLAANLTNTANPTPITLTATAQDTDGTISRVEFYDGSEKLGELLALPYRYIWNAPPLGEHRVIARAFDNLGAATDSGIVRIVIGAVSSELVHLAAEVGAANQSLRLSLSAAPGNYTIQQSADLRSWSDAFAVSVGAAGTAVVEEANGASAQARFFRVRK